MLENYKSRRVDYRELLGWPKGSPKNMKDMSSDYKDMLAHVYNLSKTRNKALFLLLQQYDECSNYSVEMLQKALYSKTGDEDINITAEMVSIFNLSMSNMHNLFDDLFSLQERLNRIIDLKKQVEEECMSLFLKPPFNKENWPSNESKCIENEGAHNHKI